MEPFVLAHELERRYADYIRTSFPFADPDLRRQLDEKIQRDRLLGSGPIVALQRDFAPGVDVADLVAANELHSKVGEVFSRWHVNALYAHQLAAYRRLRDAHGGQKSTIVATGTGSGKTE